MRPEPLRDADAPTELNPSPQVYETERLAVPLAPGQQLEAGAVLEGRFRIVRMLGQGGMGEVYEAVDVALGTRVALKTVRLEQATNESALQRFRREILLARKIAHPNVCKVFELHVGAIDEPPLFLSMELLEGETLAARLRREGRLDEAVARGIVVQIVAALGAAHREGVVHRDLKASNVMLVPDHGGAERAVVTDFGIAHAAGGLSDGTATLDGPVGTPAYMAPEQVTGGAVTPATDLYCLGVLMYELTTGTLPFAGETPAQIAYRRLGAEAPDPCGANPSLSKRWSELIRWCLANEPSQRPQTAEAFRRALEGETRPRRRLSRRRLVAIGLALVVAVAAVPLVVRHRSPRAPPAVTARPVVAVLEAANLTGDSGLDWVSTAFSEAFASSLEPTRGLRIVAPRVVAERQFSLGVATAPQLGIVDGPRRLADSLGASHLVEVTFQRDKSGSLLFEAGVRSGSRARGPASDPTYAPAATVKEVGSPEEVEAVAARLVQALRSRMGWERGDPDLRSPLIPARPLPRDPEARRLYAQGIRQLARYDPFEALFLVRRALEREPDFIAAIPLNRYSVINLRTPWSLDASDDSDLFEQGLAHVAELPPGSAEREWIEANAPEALRNSGTAERLKALLAERPDEFELALRTAALSPDFVQQFGALRALPPPLGADPRIDMAEAALRFSSGERAEASVVIDRGLAEARRRRDRLTTSWLLGLRAVLEITDGRTDEGVTSFLDAEREALVAGGSSFARQLRIGRANFIGQAGAGRMTAARQLYRQYLAELPGLGEGWQRTRPQILAQLAYVEANLGHADALRELIREMKALPPSTWLTGRIHFLGLWFIRSSDDASHREDALRREIQACGSARACVWTWTTWLGWELVDQGRPAEALKLLSEAGPLTSNLFVQIDLYAQVMADLGKAAEAFPGMQAKMRDDIRTRGGVVDADAWYAARALASCLLRMHELDEATRIVSSMARFHRAWEDVEGRAMGLAMEAELALARREVPPELPGLIRALLGEPGMSFFPRNRDELQMELGRLLLATGKEREGWTLLAEANRKATARGELKIARLARAALEGRAATRGTQPRAAVQ